MTSGSGGTGDIQAVQRVGQLLALFTAERPRLSVAEAATIVGLNRSTVSRYFGSLVLAGILERSRDEPTAYEPGKLLLQLGAVAQGRRRVLDMAPAHMRHLSREAGLSVVLSLWGPAGPVVTLVSEVGTNPILVTVRVGTVLTMDSAQGRLFLHYSGDHEALTKYWQSLRPGERTRVRALVAEAGARGLSYASAPPGMGVLAAPVFDDHDIAATIAAVGVPAEDSPAHDPSVADALRAAAYAITADLGGTEVWAAQMPAEAATR